MVKFFKSTNRAHPGHDLPTAMFREGALLFEFNRGQSGLLEFETDDPELIQEMREMGYGEEAPAAVEAKPVGGTKAPLPPKKANKPAPPVKTPPPGATGAAANKE